MRDCGQLRSRMVMDWMKLNLRSHSGDPKRAGADTQSKAQLDDSYRVGAVCSLCRKGKGKKGCRCSTEDELLWLLRSVWLLKLMEVCGSMIPVMTCAERNRDA